MCSIGEHPLHVLVIDDQKAMRSIVRDLLGQIGIKNVSEAEGGKEALECLIDPSFEFPDLIICDLHMDQMDGIQFCNAVRRDENLRNRGVPILMLTGDRDELLHEVSRQVGAMKVLTKPVTAEELKDEVAQAVGYSFA